MKTIVAPINQENCSDPFKKSGKLKYFMKIHEMKKTQIIHNHYSVHDSPDDVNVLKGSLWFA
jgi:hypothetical protein